MSVDEQFKHPFSFWWNLGFPEVPFIESLWCPVRPPAPGKGNAVPNSFQLPLLVGFSLMVHEALIPTELLL